VPVPFPMCYPHLLCSLPWNGGLDPSQKLRYRLWPRTSATVSVCAIPSCFNMMSCAMSEWVLWLFTCTARILQVTLYLLCILNFIVAYQWWIQPPKVVTKIDSTFWLFTISSIHWTVHRPYVDYNFHLSHTHTQTFNGLFFQDNLGKLAPER